MIDVRHLKLIHIHFKHIQGVIAYIIAVKSIVILILYYITKVRYKILYCELQSPSAVVDSRK